MGSIGEIIKETVEQKAPSIRKQDLASQTTNFKSIIEAIIESLINGAGFFEEAREAIISCLQNGANVDINISCKDSELKSAPALYHAIHYGLIDIVKILLKHGALPSSPLHYPEKDFPLLIALQVEDKDKREELIIMLIESGADIYQENQKGESILSVACEKKYINIIKIVLDREINALFKIGDGSQKSLFFIACSVESENVLKTLLEYRKSYYINIENSIEHSISALETIKKHLSNENIPIDLNEEVEICSKFFSETQNMLNTFSSINQSINLLIIGETIAATKSEIIAKHGEKIVAKEGLKAFAGSFTGTCAISGGSVGLGVAIWDVGTVSRALLASGPLLPIVAGVVATGLVVIPPVWWIIHTIDKQKQFGKDVNVNYTDALKKAGIEIKLENNHEETTKFLLSLNDIFKKLLLKQTLKILPQKEDIEDLITNLFTLKEKLNFYKNRTIDFANWWNIVYKEEKKLVRIEKRTILDIAHDIAIEKNNIKIIKLLKKHVITPENTARFSKNIFSIENSMITSNFTFQSYSTLRKLCHLGFCHENIKEIKTNNDRKLLKEAHITYLSGTIGLPNINFKRKNRFLSNVKLWTYF